MAACRWRTGSAGSLIRSSAPTAASLADGTATGFTFDEENPQALLAAIEQAIALFGAPSAWPRLMRRAMTRDFSWEAAARQYLALYRGMRPDLPS